MGKTCASPAVSDNGKEEEKEAEKEEEGEDGARAAVILEEGEGGDLAH